MTTRLRRLNDKGIAEFGTYLAAQKNGASQQPPLGLLDDPESSENMDVEINLERKSFANRYEIGEYLTKALVKLDRRAIAYDYRMWSWLGLYFFNDVSPSVDGVRKVLQEAVYVLGASFNHQRYYRHAIRSAWQTVLDNGTFAKVLLTTQATRSEVGEQLGAVQSIIGNPTIIQGAYGLYFDEDTQGLKKGAGGKGGGSARRLRDFVRQIELTYDLRDCSPEQFMAMLPSEFLRFKQPPPRKKDRGTIIFSSSRSVTPK